MLEEFSKNLNIFQKKEKNIEEIGEAEEKEEYLKNEGTEEIKKDI